MKNEKKGKIELLTIIGEVEGHEAVSANTKATKYEHILPKLAQIENDDEIIVFETVGVATQDLVAAREIYDKAVAAGVGMNWD